MSANSHTLRNHADASHRTESLRQRVMSSLDNGVDFIPNDEFETTPTDTSEFVEETLEQLQQSNNAPEDLPTHLRRMCESELLTPEQETALFREMNFLKYQVNVLVYELDLTSASEAQLTQIDSLLQKSQTIRDQIIQANMRLVISIVKKFVTPQQSFDEMLSDGILTLMQAVEKFDYDRGFRFSTYAYRSIARNAYRTVTSARAEEARFTRDAEDWAFEQEADQSTSTMTDNVWSNLRDLTASMLNELDRRERFIIRSRYALGAHRKVRTFQYLADKLGVSKERVRQLEQRAVGKLKAMASELEMDDIFGAAMV